MSELASELIGLNATHMELAFAEMGLAAVAAAANPTAAAGYRNKPNPPNMSNIFFGGNVGLRLEQENQIK